MPPRNYRVYGPLDIPRTDDLRQVDRKRLSGFWKNANDAASELATATGCYIFGIRAGKGARPWYVGQAKKSFKNECFTPHKLLYYNTAVLKRQGTPIMFLVARMTPGRAEIREKIRAERGRLGGKPADSPLFRRQQKSTQYKWNRLLHRSHDTRFIQESSRPTLQ